MATRAVLQTFEKYQKERVAFVSAVAEMAKNPQVCCSNWGAVDEAGLRVSPLASHMPLQNIEALQQAGAMALLRPLLLDNVPR
jgi:hypothetical protein